MKTHGLIALVAMFVAIPRLGAAQETYQQCVSRTMQEFRTEEDKMLTEGLDPQTAAMMREAMNDPDARAAKESVYRQNAEASCKDSQRAVRPGTPPAPSTRPWSPPAPNSNGAERERKTTTSTNPFAGTRIQANKVTMYATRVETLPIKNTVGGSLGLITFTGELGDDGRWRFTSFVVQNYTSCSFNLDVMLYKADDRSLSNPLTGFAWASGLGMKPNETFRWRKQPVQAYAPRGITVALAGGDLVSCD